MLLVALVQNWLYQRRQRRYDRQTEKLLQEQRLRLYLDNQVEPNTRMLDLSESSLGQPPAKICDETEHKRSVSYLFSGPEN